MRPLDIKTIQQRGNRASKVNRRMSGLMVAGLAAVFVLAGGSGYAIFYSPWFQINSVAFEGIESYHQAEAERVVSEALSRRRLGIPVGRNILFVRSGTLEASIKSLSFLEDASVEKDYFHILKISGKERDAEGVWCFGSVSLTASPECRYFDRSGVLWGQAARSSGFLLLNIDDERPVPESLPEKIDERFLSGIQTVVAGLKAQDVKIKKVVIPAESLVEFNILVSDGYPLLFSLDSNLPAQVDAYRIFRDQKLAGGDIHPQYIDMRFDGRVYFK